MNLISSRGRSHIYTSSRHGKEEMRTQKNLHHNRQPGSHQAGYQSKIVRQYRNASVYLAEKNKEEDI